MTSDDLYKKIFSKNLKHYMDINKKTQADIVTDLHIDKSTVSTWVNGTRLPRMDKVNMLAEYFNVKRSDLIEDKTNKEDEDTYYYDPEVARMVEELKNREGMRILFDATRDLSVEDIEFVVAMVERMKKGQE